PSIMAVILEIPNSFFTETIIPSVKQSFLKYSDNDPSSVIAGAVFGIAPKTVAFFMEAVSAVLFWIVWALQALISIFLTAIAPVVFLLTCLLGIGISNKIFFGLLVMTSTWPLAWYGFDQALHYLFQIVENSFGRSCIEIITLVFKGFVPILTGYLAVNSGPGRLITGGAGRMMGVGNGLWNKQPAVAARTVNQDKSGQTFENQNGRIVGTKSAQNYAPYVRVDEPLSSRQWQDMIFNSRIGSTPKSTEPNREIGAHTYQVELGGDFRKAAQGNYYGMTRTLSAEARYFGTSSNHQTISHDRESSNSNKKPREDQSGTVPSKKLYKNEVWAISCEYASQGYTNVAQKNYSGWSSEQLDALDKKWNPNGYSGPKRRSSSQAQSPEKQDQSQSTTQESNKPE
ncbi:MAG TPA: hypothetical protein PLU50_09285, partial [Pseudobdellovibrionaceae bacterium]|nr:hypothetical protein [Pseudobdellovibrionaceae bacterium]